VLATAGAAVLPATHDSIRWQGRTVRDGATVTHSWAGVSFEFTAHATTKASLVRSSVFAWNSTGFVVLLVYVDGLLVRNISLPGNAPASNVTILSAPAPRDMHVKGIFITDPITVSWDALPHFAQSCHAFAVDGGFVRPPPLEHDQRRLDIYGDSITAGNQIDPVTCRPDWAGTYGRLLCDAFGANCTCAAISGKGIYHNCCDNDATMSVLGLRALPSDAATTCVCQRSNS
jgi:hypothetical protein